MKTGGINCGVVNHFFVDQNFRLKLSRETDKYIIFFVIFALFFVFYAIFSHPIRTGGNATERWLLIVYSDEAGNFLRTLSGEMPSHHGLRWGINYPAYILVQLFGTSPFVYYIVPLFFSSLCVALLWLISYELGGLVTAFVAVFIFVLNYKVHLSSLQLMPNAFSIFYFVVSLFFAFKYINTNKVTYVVIFSLCIFLMYGGKETNLFFFPGIYLFFLITRDWRAISIVSLVLVCLFSIETLLVNAGSDANLIFGRLEALLTGGHINNMLTRPNHINYSYDDIINRWTIISIVPKIIYYSFFSLCIYGIIRFKHLDKREMLLLLLGGSFAFFTTFFIISIDPFRLGQPLRERYLLVLTPVAAISLAWAAQRAFGFVAGFARDLGVRFPLDNILKAAALMVAVFTVFGVVDRGLENDDRKSPYQRYDMFSANSYFNKAAEILRDGCPVYYLRWSGAETTLRVLTARDVNDDWRSDYAYEAVSPEVLPQIFDDDFKRLFRDWPTSPQVHVLQAKDRQLGSNCGTVFAANGAILVDIESRKSLWNVE
ncbi:ArnT family glycosyltransferase [Denitrobaculum tricleocarpae]|uniref:Uncharacterized protein n=1 Tax=Denitrobaculum tricleocarpae TaxID=2591009 RepID=A0A545TRE1_9PROT|nr:glycosyltransferase family 39 protein [Denitrobaculum tricleocarpae]TQV79784.1 hypothetical protein FKG95_13875 [Denitrobaculum tricleocarpae]